MDTDKGPQPAALPVLKEGERPSVLDLWLQLQMNHLRALDFQRRKSNLRADTPQTWCLLRGGSESDDSGCQNQKPPQTNVGSFIDLSAVWSRNLSKCDGNKLEYRDMDSSNKTGK